MTTIELEALKLDVIKAAEEFYLNKDNGVNWTDDEYDRALESVIEADPEFNIFSKLELTGKTVKHRYKFPLGNKTKINHKGWILPSVSYDTLSKLFPVIKFIAHYQNGNLRYVSAEMGDIRYSISELPKNLLPSRLLDKTFRFYGFLSKIGDKTTIDVFGVVPEVEMPTVDYKEVRLGLVKSDYITHINLHNPEDNSELTEQMSRRSEDAWLATKFVTRGDKFSPKMDGCSIVAYYKDGKLDYIATRSEDFQGKCKTNYFNRFLPETLLSGDFCLMFENVIDLIYEFGWNSRQKANGLTNSLYKIDEVSKYCTFVVYDALTSDNKRISLDSVRAGLEQSANDNFLNTIIKLSSPFADSMFTSDVDLFNTRLSMDSMDNGVVVPASLISSWVESDFKMLDYPVSEKDLSKLKITDLTLNAFPSSGILYGYRYVAVTPNKDGDTYFVFDKRDLKPKMVVVDEFIYSEIDNYVNPNLQAHYNHSKGGTFLIDGLCLHTYQKNNKTQEVEPFHVIYKFSYNEVVDSVVNEILWQESQYGSLIPLIQFDTVLVEGSWLSRAASGGYNMLMKRQMGVGAKVKIVRVNSTIPMVLSVEEPSQPKLPTCPHCNRQLTEEHDVFGMPGGARTVKCQNPECEGKYLQKKWFTDDETKWPWYDGKDVYDGIVDSIKNLIPMEGYNGYAKSIKDETKKSIFRCLVKETPGEVEWESNFSTFVTLLKTEMFINMNPLHEFNFRYSVTVAFKVLRNIMRNYNNN